MNLTEYLMSSLGEECTEIAKETSKANRFGLLDAYAGTDNREKIIQELNDLFGVLEMMKQFKILPRALRSEERVAEKREKILKYIIYANKVTKTLSLPKRHRKHCACDYCKLVKYVRSMKGR